MYFLIYKEGNVGSGVDDSSDDDQWEIIEEDPPAEIDEALDDKSSKFSLSVMNVKSIIHVSYFKYSHIYQDSLSFFFVYALQRQ